MSEAPISEITITEMYMNSETESLSSNSSMEDIIINITGQLEIIDNKLYIKINKDGYNNKIIEEVNKELEILEELKNTYKKNKELNNNEIYKKEIEKLKKELNNNYEIEILKYKNKLSIMESNMKEYYETKINILNDKIENENETYKNKELNIINKYETKVNILEDRIQEFTIRVNNIKVETAENSKHEMKYLSKENERLIQETEQLKKEKDQLYTITNKKCQTKGREGELEILEYLKSKFEYSNAIVEYVGKDQKYSSDVYLEYEKLKCVIEIKKHESLIQKNDIKKFEEVYIKKESYNCGMFISLESEYSAMSNRQDFNIMYIDDKPIIYLSNVSNNINKIIFGIKILNYLLENKNQNNFELIFNLLKAQIHNYSNLNKKLINMNQILNEVILDTKNNKKEIEKIINVQFKEDEDDEEIKSKHYKKLENNLIQCNYCNQKPYDVNKTKSYIIKHLLEKHNTIITVDDF